MGRGRTQGRVYTLCGALLLAGILYLNLNERDTISISIPIPWLQPKLGFVCTNATHFFINGDDGDCNKPSSASSLYLNGWNSYWLLGVSATGRKDKVSEMLRRGREMGMVVCRTWAFSDGGPNALQISPGRFDEKVFQALDYVIYEARRNGVRLILSLVNNLSALGGKPMYVNWANVSGVNVSDSGGDSFFRDPTIKRYYRDYVKAIITRRNRYSGVKYSDEPAIFAWELMNEPRCDSSSSAPLLQAWIVEMASFVKSLDKQHLVTIGLEGFYGPKTSKRLMANPGDWAASVGSDFIQNSATQHIDFASVHAYPDNWIPNASLPEKAKYLMNWVDSHINDSEQVLNKPVLFTEVGAIQHSSDILMKTVYDKIYESAQRGRAGAGAFIWQLLVEGMQEYGDEFSLVANSKDRTTASKLIIQQSCRLQYMLLRKGETNTSVERPCTGVVLD